MSNAFNDLDQLIQNGASANFFIGKKYNSFDTESKGLYKVQIETRMDGTELSVDERGHTLLEAVEKAVDKFHFFAGEPLKREFTGALITHDETPTIDGQDEAQEDNGIPF